MGKWSRMMSGEASPEQREAAKEVAAKLYDELTDAMTTQFLGEAIGEIRPSSGEVDNPFIIRGWTYYVDLTSSSLGSGTFIRTVPEARVWLATYKRHIHGDSTPELQASKKEIHAGIPDPTPNEMHAWLTTSAFPETWDKKQGRERLRRVDREFREKYPGDYA